MRKNKGGKKSDLTPNVQQLMVKLDLGLNQKPKLFKRNLKKRFFNKR